MNKLMIKICSIALCIVPVFCLASCNDDASISSSSSSSVVEMPSPIKELKLAIKKNPTEYHNKLVTLQGTIVKEDGKTILYDYHYYRSDSDSSSEIAADSLIAGVQERAEIKKKESIEVILLDNVQSYVVESYDYVQIVGTVRITSNGIYLDKCACTIL